MLKHLSIASILLGLFTVTTAQKNIRVPAAVRSAQIARYPNAKQVVWEKENGNFEANWGGRSGEDHSVLFTPAGEFIQMVDAVSIGTLPASILRYVRLHFHGAVIKEAGLITNAKGKQTFGVEIKGRDLVFDLDGKYVGSHH